MPADIIDLTTVRLIRDLDAVQTRAQDLMTLAEHQQAACRRAALRLEDLRAGLRRFSTRLDQHHRRCKTSAKTLRTVTEALESDDIDRMIEARDALAHRMGPAGARACHRWTAVRRHH